MDIARESGVSKATVDRVINNRAGVHDRTRDVVMAAAARLGYFGAGGLPGPIAQRLSLHFILPADTNQFMHKLHDELLLQSAARADVSAHMHRIDAIDPDGLAAELSDLEGRCDGVAMVAIDHPTVRAAIKRLARAGTKIVTLVSDVQNVPRLGYVGIDNRSAGRLSGYLFSRILPPGKQKIALFSGSVSYRGHEEREMGFRQVLAEQRDRLEIVGFSEIRDDDALSYGATVEHLERHPDLAGLYNIGAGNRGIARALTDLGRADDVVFIGHDLTDDTRGYLVSGVMDVVIDQNPRVEAREAIEQLSRLIRGLGWSSHPLRIQVIFKENIPEELD
jgi:LacI family transcriptional regulator